MFGLNAFAFAAIKLRSKLDGAGGCAAFERLRHNAVRADGTGACAEVDAVRRGRMNGKLYALRYLKTQALVRGLHTDICAGRAEAYPQYVPIQKIVHGTLLWQLAALRDAKRGAVRLADIRLAGAPVDLDGLYLVRRVCESACPVLAGVGYSSPIR